MTPVRLFLADDHDVVLDGLRLYVSGAPDIDVAGEATTASDAVERIERLAPDVAIIDVMLPDGDGIDVIRTLRARGTLTRFVVFTSHEGEDVLLRARMAGAAGYLFKDASRSRLLSTVRAVANGEELIGAAELDDVRARGTPADLDDLLPSCTAQERRIVELITEGATNREIGQRLGLTEKTARNYVSTILSKLGLRNRTEVAVHVTRRMTARGRDPRVGPGTLVG